MNDGFNCFQKNLVAIGKATKSYQSPIVQQPKPCSVINDCNFHHYNKTFGHFQLQKLTFVKRFLITYCMPPFKFQSPILWRPKKVLVAIQQSSLLNWQPKPILVTISKVTKNVQSSTIWRLKSFSITSYYGFLLSAIEFLVTFSH